MNLKNAIAAVLLLFVAYSLTLLAAKRLVGHSDTDASPKQVAATDDAPGGLAADRVVVYYFHGRERCENCRNLEVYAHEAIKKAAFADQLAAGEIEWRVVDFSRAEDAHYDQDFKLGGISCVALAEMRNGVEVRKKVLDDGLMLAVTGTKEQVIDYVQREVREFIGD